MPRATLLRATHMEVLAADPGNRSRAHAHLKRREWLGLLEREMEQHIVAGEEDEAATRGFVITSSDRGIQPCGPSMVSACRSCRRSACYRRVRGSQSGAYRAGGVGTSRMPCEPLCASG